MESALGSNDVVLEVADDHASDADLHLDDSVSDEPFEAAVEVVVVGSADSSWDSDGSDGTGSSGETPVVVAGFPFDIASDVAAAVEGSEGSQVEVEYCEEPVEGSAAVVAVEVSDSSSEASPDPPQSDQHGKSAEPSSDLVSEALPGRRGVEEGCGSDEGLLQ